MNKEQLNTSDVDLIRDTVRRLLADLVRREDPGHWDLHSIYPDVIVEKLGQLGLCGLTVPEEYGGAGRNIPAAIAVVEELSKKSLAIAVPYIMSTFYGGMNILECGSDAQREQFLPRLSSGELKFAFGVTESDTGADVASVRTTAKLAGGNAVIEGSKRFITGANIADYIYTLVRSGEPDARYKNLSIVLIPREAAGVEITKIESMGMRGGAYTCDVTFNEVKISTDLIVGGMPAWNNAWTMMAGPGLDVERLEVAAMALGIATAALEDAWQYSQIRKQFGKAICGHQSVRHLLADAQTDLQACRLMLDHASKMAQTGHSCRTESAMAKLFVCEKAKQIVLNSQTVVGAYGLVREFDMERYVRDILILPIAGGSSAIQRNNIASSMGLPKE